MIEQEFPPGWDADRVRQLAEHYERLSEEEQTAEDEQAELAASGQTVISVPEELLPAIRQLLATQKSA